MLLLIWLPSSKKLDFITYYLHKCIIHVDVIDRRVCGIRMDKSTNGSKRFSKIEIKKNCSELFLVRLKVLVEFLRAQFSDHCCLLFIR
jgi:hypothetical protein